MNAKIRTTLHAILISAALALWGGEGWPADPSPPADPAAGHPPKLISVPHHAGLTQPLVKGWHTFPLKEMPNWHALPIERKLGGGAPVGASAPLALYSLGSTNFGLTQQSAASSPVNTSSTATPLGYDYKGETTITFAPGSGLLVGGFNQLATIGCGAIPPCAPGSTVANIFGNLAQPSWTTSTVPLNIGTTTCVLGFCNILGYDPSLAVSSNHKTFFYSYGVCGADLYSCSSGSLMIATSADGKSWTNHEVTSTVKNAFLFFDDKPYMAADPVNPGRAYVAWTRNATVLDTTTGLSYAVQVIDLAQTNDYGQHWSNPRNQYTTLNTPNAVSDPTNLQGAVIFAMPAPSPNGSKVFVIWIDYSQIPNRLLLSACTPSSRTNPIPTCDPSHGHPILSLNAPIQTDITCNSGRAITVTPSIAVAPSGRLYVTFADVPAGATTYSIFLMFSDDGGNTWSGPYRLNDDTNWQSSQHYFPALSVAHSTGDVYVSWLDRRNDQQNDCLTETFSTYTDGTLTNGALNVAHNLNVSVSKSDYDGDINGNGPGDYTGTVGLMLGKNLQYPLWPDHPTVQSTAFDIFTEEVTGP